MSNWVQGSKPNRHVLRDGPFCATVGCADDGWWWWVLYHGDERLDGGSEIVDGELAMEIAEEELDKHAAAFALERED